MVFVPFKYLSRSIGNLAFFHIMRIWTDLERQIVFSTVCLTNCLFLDDFFQPEISLNLILMSNSMHLFNNDIIILSIVLLLTVKTKGIN